MCSESLELGIRNTIHTALGGNDELLPAHLREKMIAEMEKNNRDPEGASLAELLSFSYFLDLEKIIKSEPVWAVLGNRFPSKRQMEKQFSAIAKIRNPLAHARTVPTDTRREGEEALALLRASIGSVTPRG